MEQLGDPARERARGREAARAARSAKCLEAAIRRRAALFPGAGWWVDVLFTPRGRRRYVIVAPDGRRYATMRAALAPAGRTRGGREGGAVSAVHSRRRRAAEEAAAAAARHLRLEPPDDWRLSPGRAEIDQEQLPILCIVGELSCCRYLGEALGGADEATEAAWRVWAHKAAWCRDEASVFAERRAEALRLLTPPFAELRGAAARMRAALVDRRAPLLECHRWDTWLASDAGEAALVARVLRHLALDRRGGRLRAERPGGHDCAVCLADYPWKVASRERSPVE